MRRRAGSILPTEHAILEAGLDLHADGTAEFHGYLLARQMRDAAGARKLLAYGTLYKALDRLQVRGFLESRSEDPALAEAEKRPRRRLYRVTATGAAALQAEPATPAALTPKLSQEPAS